MFEMLFSTVESLLVASMLLLFMINAILYGAFYLCKQTIFVSYTAVKGFVQKLPIITGNSNLHID